MSSHLSGDLFAARSSKISNLLHIFASHITKFSSSSNSEKNDEEKQDSLLSLLSRPTLSVFWMFKTNKQKNLLNDKDTTLALFCPLLFFFWVFLTFFFFPLDDLINSKSAFFPGTRLPEVFNSHLGLYSLLKGTFLNTSFYKHAWVPRGRRQAYTDSAI